MNLISSRLFTTQSVWKAPYFIENPSASFSDASAMTLNFDLLHQKRKNECKQSLSNFDVSYQLVSFPCIINSQTTVLLHEYQAWCAALHSNCDTIHPTKHQWRSIRREHRRFLKIQDNSTWKRFTADTTVPASNAFNASNITSDTLCTEKSFLAGIWNTKPSACRLICLSIRQQSWKCYFFNHLLLDNSVYGL